MDWTQTLTVMGISVTGFFFILNRMDTKFEKLLGRMDANQKENNSKFEAMNGRFNGLENRLTATESEIKSINQVLGQRIDSTNQRITDFKTDINQRLATIEGYLVPKKVFHFEEPHKVDSDELKEN